MDTKPGINQYNVVDRSVPACSSILIQSEKNNTKSMNKSVIVTLIKKDEDAIETLSNRSPLPLTYLIWAFFNRPLFVTSNTEVTVKNKAHVPISAVVSTRTNIIKFINPKNVRENRCRIV